MSSKIQLIADGNTINSFDSLSSALKHTLPASTLRFPPNSSFSLSKQTINLTSKSLTIEGSGNSTLVLDASYFNLTNNNARLTLSKLNVQVKRLKHAIFNCQSHSSLGFEECVFDLSQETDIPAFHVRGGLSMKGCLVNNLSILIEEEDGQASGEILNTHFVNKNESNHSAALTIVGSTEMTKVVKCEFKGYKTGIIVENDKVSGKVEVSDSNFEVRDSGIVSKNVALKVSKVKVRSPKGIALAVKGKRAKNVSIADSEFYESVSGVIVSEEAQVEIKRCSFKGCFHTGISARSKSVVNIEECKVFGSDELSGDTNMNGLEVLSESKVKVNQLNLENLTGYGIILQDSESKLSFDNMEIKAVVEGVSVLGGSELAGNNLNVTGCTGPNLVVRGRDTVCSLKDVNINGGTVGLSIFDGCLADVKNFKCKDVLEKGIEIFDASAEISETQINNKGTSKPGITVGFKVARQERVTLRDCKVMYCSEGIRTVQNEIEYTQTPSTRSDGLYFDPDDGKTEKLSKTELENCAFVQCDFGFFVDSARVSLKGCSFIMNKKHSVFIKNRNESTNSQLNKSSRLKIRWPNYVEPYIDNGQALSNNPQALTNVTHEKAFCGSADFEPVMYLPTLTERIRQARNLFRSRDELNVPKARVIMRSVSHMLILLNTLTDRLLNKELLDDPDLGMFAATFKLSQQKPKKRSNTLVQMEALFKSWKSLSRTRLFDSALYALNEAFERRQVDEDLYDTWVTPLEEMQRVCYVKSKYNRRRDYLLTTAKETPLTTWYFLDKEDPSTDEGKKLRSEVLMFLATDAEEHRAHNKTGFHASWVAQWAINLMGNEFTKKPMPRNEKLRIAWADKLLDLGRPKQILDEYAKRGNGLNDTIDQVIKFDALRMHEDNGHKLSQDDYQKLQNLLNGEGFQGAIKASARTFKGVGSLPGFLRRLAERAKDAESLLDSLSAVDQDQNQPDRKLRKRTVLAVMSHFLHPDAQEQPFIYHRKDNRYETCPLCLVQKLQPWNELKLSSCNDSTHRLCRPCMKTAMSEGNNDSWGKCPGVTNGKPCNCHATRREMEMALMDQNQIFNIIEKRVSHYLSRLKGWRSCDAPGCIGGRSGVTNSFFTCRLCKKMVTEDGGRSDPTVIIRLLRGLDSSPIARGEGVFRECYWCAAPYEKGNACSTITCANCNKSFSMTYGPENNTHRFDEEGVQPQHYVPKKPGLLHGTGVFKDRKGRPLKLGAVLNQTQALEVVRRAKVKLAQMDC